MAYPTRRESLEQRAKQLGFTGVTVDQYRGYHLVVAERASAHVENLDALEALLDALDSWCVRRNERPHSPLHHRGD